MGFYDHYCGASGLSLLGQDCDLFLLRETSTGFAPVCPPVRGNYNRFGSIDGFEEKGAYAAIGAGLRRLVGAGRVAVDWQNFDHVPRGAFTLEQFFEMAEKHWEFKDSVTFDGSPIAFMLIQADVSDAIAQSAPAVQARGIPDLVHRAFAGVEPGPSLVASLSPSDAEPLLLRTVQLRSWVDAHDGWHPHDEAGQHGDEEILASVADARKRFAGSPRLLAVVDLVLPTYGIEE